MVDLTNLCKLPEDQVPTAVAVEKRRHCPVGGKCGDSLRHVGAFDRNGIFDPGGKEPPDVCPALNNDNRVAVGDAGTSRQSLVLRDICNTSTLTDLGDNLIVSQAGFLDLVQ